MKFITRAKKLPTTITKSDYTSAKFTKVRAHAFGFHSRNVDFPLSDELKKQFNTIYDAVYYLTN